MRDGTPQTVSVPAPPVQPSLAATLEAGPLRSSARRRSRPTRRSRLILMALVLLEVATMLST